MASTNQDDPARPGNEFYVRNEYEKAVVAYSTAIEKNPNVSKLYSNRALTYLKLDRPLHALKDVDIGLKLDPNNDKLVYRKCKALLALRRFSDAGQFLHESIRRFDQLSKNKEFKTLINDMDRLKTEYERGQFDLPAMIEESKKSKCLDNHAHYFAGNKFEIREIDGKGRGLVARQKIKAGELLIGCKAFVFVDTESVASRAMDLPIAERMEVTRIAMVEKARKKLLDRPDLAGELYRLYAGPKLGHLDKWTDGDSELIDVERIESIIRLNYIEVPHAIGEEKTAVRGLIDGGLWLIPSYISHTCVDRNCCAYFVGDYMFVRATKSIKKDEEILFHYCPPMESFENRQRICRDTFGFDCQCRLCTMERQEPIEISQRMKEIRKAADALERMEETSDKATLENMFKESLELRPQRDLNYLALRVQDVLAVFTVNTRERCRLMMEYYDVQKSNGEFTVALMALKRMYRAPQFKGMGEREKWKKDAREIAKLIYGDERVADLVFTKD